MQVVESKNYNGQSAKDILGYFGIKISVKSITVHKYCNMTEKVTDQAGNVLYHDSQLTKMREYAESYNG